MKNDFAVLVAIHQREDIELNFNSLVDSIYLNTLQPSVIWFLVDGPINLSFKEKIEVQKNLKKFNVFYHSTNIGLANILNLGLKKIEASWIIRVDGDDLCLPDRFKKLMQFAHPNISIIGSYIQEIDEKQKIRIKKVPLTHGRIKKYMKYRNPFNHCSIAYNKDHVIKIGGYPNLFLKEDYGLWVKMIANGYQAMNIPEVLVNAQFDSNSYIRRSGIKYLKSDLELNLLMLQLKIINIFEFILFFIIRSLFIMTPNFIKKNLYQILRSF